MYSPRYFGNSEANSILAFSDAISEANCAIPVESRLPRDKRPSGLSMPSSTTEPMVYHSFECVPVPATPSLSEVFGRVIAIGACLKPCLSGPRSRETCARTRGLRNHVPFCSINELVVSLLIDGRTALCKAILTSSLAHAPAQYQLVVEQGAHATAHCLTNCRMAWYGRP